MRQRPTSGGNEIMSIGSHRRNPCSRESPKLIVRIKQADLASLRCPFVPTEVTLMADSDTPKNPSLDSEQAVLALYRAPVPCSWYRDCEDPALAHCWDGLL